MKTSSISGQQSVTKTFYLYKKKLVNDYHLHGMDSSSLIISVRCLYTLDEWDLDLYNFYISFYCYIMVYYIYTTGS